MGLSDDTYRRINDRDPIFSPFNDRFRFSIRTDYGHEEIEVIGKNCFHFEMMLKELDSMRIISSNYKHQLNIASGSGGPSITNVVKQEEKIKVTNKKLLLI